MFEDTKYITERRKLRVTTCNIWYSGAYSFSMKTLPTCRTKYIILLLVTHSYIGLKSKINTHILVLHSSDYIHVNFVVLVIQKL